MRVKDHEVFENVYWAEKKGRKPELATINLAPGNKVYGEKLVRFRGTEYRIWDPYRSKLAAAIHQGIKDLPIREGSRVLYLGAASGTTASHVSDIVGAEGMVNCVEISSRPLRDLLITCERRPNMIPILADAARVDSYRVMIDRADVIYQDIAHPNQTTILLENSQMFLREGDHVLMALKARSVDVTREPREIFREEVMELEERMEVIDSRLLDPYSKDHAMFLLRK